VELQFHTTEKTPLSAEPDARQK